MEVVDRSILHTQTRDTLYVGEAKFDLDASTWSKCTNVKRGPESHGYNVRIRCKVSSRIAETFVALLQTGSLALPPDVASKENLMDLWLLCSTVGHHPLCLRLEQELEK